MNCRQERTWDLGFGLADSMYHYQLKPKFELTTTETRSAVDSTQAIYIPFYIQYSVFMNAFESLAKLNSPMTFIICIKPYHTVRGTTQPKIYKIIRPTLPSFLPYRRTFPAQLTNHDSFPFHYITQISTTLPSTLILSTFTLD